MEVQVILGQIGESRHIIMQTAHTLQANGMGGDLHNGIATAAITHLTQQCLQIQTLGRGTLGGDSLMADHIFHSAHQAYLRTQHLLDHML